MENDCGMRWDLRGSPVDGEVGKEFGVEISIMAPFCEEMIKAAEA
jgi:hypothetical protein